MRHGKAFRKFSRKSAHRRSMFRNMATSLVLAEGCRTTIEKAKEVRKVIEKLVTKARTDSLTSRKQVHAYLQDPAAVKKLFTVIGPRYKGRPGGYTRIVRLDRRTGDAAQMALIEFVDRTDPTTAVAPAAAPQAEKKAAKKTNKAA